MKEDDLAMPTLRKGQLLMVKVPPYYDKSYCYEIVSAGKNQIRANLLKSPKVRKLWSYQELKLLFAMGIVRFAHQTDLAES